MTQGTERADARDAKVAMRRGYALVKVARDTSRTAEVITVALELPGVERIGAVTGPFDMILHLRVPARRAESLMEAVRAVPGVLRVLPCWAIGEVDTDPTPQVEAGDAGVG